MSFFSNLLGGSGPNVSSLQRKQSALIDQTQGLYDRLLDNYGSSLRSGAYDPHAALEQLRADSAYQTRIHSGNAAAAAKTLGYRPGDSEPLVQQNAMNQKATLDYDRLANQIRSNATDRSAAALGSVAGLGSSLLGQGIAAYGDQIQQGLAQQAQSNGFFGSLLGSAMPYLSTIGRRTR